MYCGITVMEPTPRLFDYAASPYGGRPGSSAGDSHSDSHSDSEHPGPVAEFAATTPYNPEHYTVPDDGDVAELVNLYSDDDASSIKPSKVYDLGGTSDTPPQFFSDSSDSTTIDSTGGFRDDDVHDFGEPLPQRTYGSRLAQHQRSRRSSRSVWTKSRPHVSTFDTLATTTTSIQDDLEKRRQLESLFDGKMDEHGEPDSSSPYDAITSSVPEVVPGGGPMPSVRFNGSRYTGFGSESMPHGGAGGGGGGGGGGAYPGSYGSYTPSGPYQHSHYQTTPSYSYTPPAASSDSDSDDSTESDVSSMDSLSDASDMSNDSDVEQVDDMMVARLSGVGQLTSDHYSKSTALQHLRTNKTPDILEYRFALQRTIRRKKQRAQCLLEITHELERALKKHYKKFNAYAAELIKYRNSMRQTKFAPFDESWLDLTKPPQKEANDWFWVASD